MTRDEAEQRSRETCDRMGTDVDRLRGDDAFRALRKLLLSRDVSWTGGHGWEVAVADAIEVLDAYREAAS